MLLSNSNPAIYFAVFMKRKTESARNVLFVAAQTGNKVKISCLNAETRDWGDVAVPLPSYAVESVRLRRHRRVRCQRRRRRRQPQKANPRFLPKRLRRELKGRRTTQHKCHQRRSTALNSPRTITKTIPMQPKKKRVSFWYG